MKKPPSAGMSTDGNSQQRQSQQSPEKKKQKKQHNNTKEQMPLPTQLFADISTKPRRPTPLWNHLRKQFPDCGKGYEPSHLFAESGRSLHDSATKATTLLSRILNEDPNKTKKRNPPPSQWEKLFQQAIKEKFPLGKADCHFVINLLMDLSLTKPFPIFQTFQTTNGGLRSTIMTNLWAAAQSTCGSNHTTPSPSLPTHFENTSPSYKEAVQQKSPPSSPPKTPPTNPYKSNEPKPTPRTSNQKPQAVPLRRYRERYDMKLFIAPTQGNPINGFVSRIKEWFEMLKTLDPALIILPWFKNTSHKPIISPNDVPKEMKQLRHYFQRLSPKSGIIWTKVHISTDHDPKDITSGPTTQLGWWYKDHDEGLYLRPLRDAEMTQDLGILAYTSNFTDAEATMSTINHELQNIGCKFPIGGKMRPIKAIKVDESTRSAHRSKGGSWYNQHWFAMHLISDSKHQRQAIKYLYKMFNQKNKPQPGGLRARFIPHESVMTMSSTASDKRFKMLNKHQAVIKALKLIRVDSILQLDVTLPDTNMSLRQYLMSLTHSTTGNPLYHSVDRSPSFIDEGSNTVILTTLPDHEAEAAALASVLPALCQQKLHASSHKWFSSEAVEHCEGVLFDADSNKFQSQEDHLFDDMLEEDFGKTIMIEFDDSVSLQTQKKTPSSNDDNSFVSFGTILEAKKPSPSQTTGTDSLSSPSFPTESTNSTQAELMAATTAENESLRQQIESLLLEKSKWDSSHNSQPHPQPQSNNTPTTSQLSEADVRSKNISQGDE